MQNSEEIMSSDQQTNKTRIVSEKHEKILSGKIQNCLEFCSDKDNCLSLNDILRSFNAPLSEEQAWSLIYQSVQLYRNFIHIEFIDKQTKKDAKRKSSHRIKVPKSTKNLNVHKDGSVHISDGGKLKDFTAPMELNQYFKRMSCETDFSLSRCGEPFWIAFNAMEIELHSIFGCRPDLLYSSIHEELCNSCSCSDRDCVQKSESRRFTALWSISTWQEEGSWNIDEIENFLNKNFFFSPSLLAPNQICLFLYPA